MPSIKDVMGPPTPNAQGTPPDTDVPPPEQEQQAAAEPQVTDDDAYASQEPTPEEQAMYEKVVLAGTDALTDDASHPKIMKILQSEKDDPPRAIADAALFIMAALDGKSQRTIPQQVIIKATGEIAEQVAEVAEAAKVFKVTHDVLQKAGMFVVNQLAQTYGTTPEQVQQMMDQFTPEQQEQARAQNDAIVNPQDQPMGRDQTGNIASQQQGA